MNVITSKASHRSTSVKDFQLEEKKEESLTGNKPEGVGLELDGSDTSSNDGSRSRSSSDVDNEPSPGVSDEKGASISSCDSVSNDDNIKTVTLDDTNKSNVEEQKDNQIQSPTEKQFTSPKSLKERSRVPPGFIAAALLLFSLFICTGFLTNISSVGSHFYLSLITSYSTSKEIVFNTTAKGLISKPFNLVVLGVLICIGHVLVYNPFRAGFWTGERSRKHKVHRYFGLLFLLQYSVAWFEFLMDYHAASRSYLPLTIALNGVIQSTSAFFSFKVLPSLKDAGYYSDKAVISRDFVFENTFYQLMTVFGAFYYHDQLRGRMKSTFFGQAIEVVFVFVPYVVLRPLFPTTRFKDAGSSQQGRTKQNEMFYTIGTTMVKIFYLWAKYFLGFFINWLVFLGIPTEDDMKLIRGLFLLNAGTCSIAVFLHTLRFKKVFPGRITFSMYLCQIYATFSAIPYAYSMFTSHHKLTALTFLGILCNMTRSRKIHSLWCLVSLYLIKFTDIQW